MNPTPQDQVPAPAPEASGPSRRALLRAGVGASPVLLALASRPVSAANSCTVASSFVSVATFRSRNPTSTSLQCSTRTPQDWYTEACLPAVGIPSRPAYLDVTVSSLLGATTSQYNGSTLWSVLKNDPAGIVTTGQLGALQHLVAMALNLQKGHATDTGSINILYLQGVWQNYVSNGGRYVLPASNIDWDTPKLVSWLRMLMYPISF
jgi:hypothetical protein